ncbi:MAG: YqeG family HAD IIIA-type phosphatase, partial [Candidatus Eremiobacteraeota bacterium]|nr:YqeG family HAD IIIA-type phosphatase [Candidatus Eremiobacteraeota bacterium]
FGFRSREIRHRRTDVKWKGGWLRPTSFAKRINDISLELLRKDGIVGIIVDLDNTLVGYRIGAPDEAVARWVRDALEHGFKVAMVTNNATQWARNIALGLEIPCIPNARKPSPRGFLRAMRLIETDRQSTVVVGDQLFTDVLGAKIFGMKVILTEPIVPREEWWMRFLRFFERIILYRVPRV